MVSSEWWKFTKIQDFEYDMDDVNNDVDAHRIDGQIWCLQSNLRL